MAAQLGREGQGQVMNFYWICSFFSIFFSVETRGSGLG